MSKISSSQVVIYHDETKDVPGRNFKGHVLFFIPVRLSVKSNTPMFGVSSQEYSPKKMLFEKILKIRQEFFCNGKLHFSQLSGKTWTKYDFAYLKSMELAVDALRHKSQRLFPHPLNCKIALVFYPKGADWNIYSGDSRKEQKFRHDETLLRILLKGAAHYLFNNDNYVEVLNIISDGDPAHRKLDEERVLWRLIYDDFYDRTPLRDYVSLDPNASIIHLPKSDHKQYQINTEEYIDANFLQVSDLLLGAVMRACYVGINITKTTPNIEDECVKKDIITQPVKEMLDKERKRGAGFRYSGHYRSFVITQVNFDNKGIKFEKVQSTKIQDQESLQMKFAFKDSVVISQR